MIQRRTIRLILLFINFLFIPTFSSFAHINLTIDANLPSWSDEEFSQNDIRIETFGRETCPYCQLLKANLYPAIDKTFSFDHVAIRYLNMNHPQVKSYLLTIEEQFDLEENLRGAIPATLINGRYLILGYSEQSTPFYLNLIERIQRGDPVEPDADQYLYVLNKSKLTEGEIQFFNLTVPSLPIMIGVGFVTLLTACFYFIRNRHQKKSSS